MKFQDWMASCKILSVERKLFEETPSVGFGGTQAVYFVETSTGGKSRRLSKLLTRNS